jgi:glycosyltransferase involved in cell wall biosynthesis
MRVLVVHNRYSSRVPSGENLAVDDEVRWLRDAGVDVVRHEVSNDDIVSPGPVARARDGLEATWSPAAGRAFGRVLDDVRPDVVHVHNLFPLLTGSVPATARRRGLPVVWTVHNFRVRCVAGTHFRDGRPCHACRPGYRLPGVIHRCYAGSLAASALVGSATSVYLAVARRRAIHPIAISDEIAAWLASSAGFEPADIRVKYNGVASPPAATTAPGGRRNLLYIGRLSREKGVDLLLEAWARTTIDAELHLVGSGPLADDVQAAARADPRLVPWGQVPGAEVASHIDRARAVVMPSVWREPFGRAAAEALAHGRPVITTGRGASAEVVGTNAGWIVGTDVAMLSAALTEAASSDALVDAKGAAGRARHAALFSPEATTGALIAIYDQVTNVTRR